VYIMYVYSGEWDEKLRNFGCWQYVLNFIVNANFLWDSSLAQKIY
jgi:hypothetical protein